MHAPSMSNEMKLMNDGSSTVLLSDARIDGGHVSGSPAAAAASTRVLLTQSNSERMPTFEKTRWSGPACERTVHVCCVDCGAPAHLKRGDQGQQTAGPPPGSESDGVWFATAERGAAGGAQDFGGQVI